MGLSRLKQLAVGGILLLGAALPAHAFTFFTPGPTPNSIPTTTVQNDFWITGNGWTQTGVGFQASTSNFWCLLRPSATMAQSTLYVLPDLGVSGVNLVGTPTGTTGNIVKSRVFNVPCNGEGAAGTLVTSKTYQYVIAPGRAGTVTLLSTGAITVPSATTDVTVQFFKNNTSTAISAAFDLHGGTSGSSVLIPITGNATLGAFDIIICQVVTGASLGSAAGVCASAEVLTTDY